MKESDKGVNKTTKGRLGTGGQQHWKPKTTIPDLPTETRGTKIEKDKEKIQQLEQRKQESQQKTHADCGTRPPKDVKHKVRLGLLKSAQHKLGYPLVVRFPFR